MLRFFVIGAIGGILGFTANMLALEMLDQVNQKLPADKQISWMWYGNLRIKRQHREMYPDSKLRFLLNVCVAGLAVLFLATMWYWVLGN